MLSSTVTAGPGSGVCYGNSEREGHRRLTGRYPGPEGPALVSPYTGVVV